MTTNAPIKINVVHQDGANTRASVNTSPVQTLPTTSPSPKPPAKSK